MSLVFVLNSQISFIPNQNHRIATFRRALTQPLVLPKVKTVKRKGNQISILDALECFLLYWANPLVGVHFGILILKRVLFGLLTDRYNSLQLQFVLNSGSKYEKLNQFESLLDTIWAKWNCHIQKIQERILSEFCAAKSSQYLIYPAQSSIPLLALSSFLLSLKPLLLSDCEL